MERGMPGTSEVTVVAKENGQKGQVLQILCAKCRTATRHAISQSLEKKGTEVCYEAEGTFDLHWSDAFLIVECQGCESVSFMHRHWYSEADGAEEHVYPQRSDRTLPAREYLNAAFHVRRIYRETIEAFNYETYTLCGAGLRAIVEGICAEHGITDGPVTRLLADGTTTTTQKDNLEGRIGGLGVRGILTASQARVLHEHRFLGNEALHELSLPNPTDLQIAIKIIEHVLDGLYEIPKTGAELQERRQQRNAAKGKDTK